MKELVICFRNLEEMQEAYKMGVLPNLPSYYGYPEYHSFPTLMFTIDNKTNTLVHQPLFSDGELIWNRKKYRQLLSRAKTWEKVKKEMGEKPHKVKLLVKKIESCDKCPYCKFLYHDYTENGDHYLCRLEGHALKHSTKAKNFASGIEIPDWCPLEDYKEQ